MFQIALNDFAAQLSEQTGKNIRISQTAANQITAHYLMNIKLDLLGHSDDSLKFRYTLPLGAGMLLNLLGNIKSKKCTLNTQDKTVWLHLNAFAAYRNHLADQKITRIDLHNGILTLQTAPKEAA